MGSQLFGSCPLRQWNVSSEEERERERERERKKWMKNVFSVSANFNRILNVFESAKNEKMSESNLI